MELIPDNVWQVVYVVKILWADIRKNVAGSSKDEGTDEILIVLSPEKVTKFLENAHQILMLGEIAFAPAMNG